MMSPQQILSLRTKLEILKDIVEDDIKILRNVDVKEARTELMLIRKQRQLNKIIASIGTVNYIMSG